MKTKQVCRRCGGSGSFSFNLKDGTVCYGCNGSGFQMVDAAAIARRQATAAKKHAESLAKQSAYIAAMTAVKNELNAVFGPFDLSTLLGIDKLNCVVYRATGKNLVSHCKERLAV